MTDSTQAPTQRLDNSQFPASLQPLVGSIHALQDISEVLQQVNISSAEARKFVSLQDFVESLLQSQAQELIKHPDCPAALVGEHEVEVQRQKTESSQRAARAAKVQSRAEAKAKKKLQDSTPGEKRVQAETGV